jgi:hypothetical protein
MQYATDHQTTLRQVSRFLESPDLALTPGAPTPALDPTIKQRLLRHLDTCVAELDLDIGLSSSAEGNRDTVKAEADSEARPDSSTATGSDENNNGNQAMNCALARAVSALTCIRVLGLDTIVRGPSVLKQILVRKFWGFNGGGQEECRILECDATWLLQKPTFGGTCDLQHQGGKNRRARNNVHSVLQLPVTVNVVPSPPKLSPWWWRRYVPPKRRLIQ